ncbi:DUF2892 domain-containing protein [Alicyclobacillaceae bacterium I2511]|nr:DUF2892 domain-containing protein [Alicyclobacillaceae bacterium I2511]
MQHLQNESPLDRIIRIFLALALIVVSMVIPKSDSIVLIIIAIVSLLTGVIGICPLYNLFHIRTLKKVRG